MSCSFSAVLHLFQYDMRCYKPARLQYSFDSFFSLFLSELLSVCVSDNISSPGPLSVYGVDFALSADAYMLRWLPCCQIYFELLLWFKCLRSNLQVRNQRNRERAHASCSRSARARRYCAHYTLEMTNETEWHVLLERAATSDDSRFIQS